VLASVALWRQIAGFAVGAVSMAWMVIALKRNQTTEFAASEAHELAIISPIGVVTLLVAGPLFTPPALWPFLVILALPASWTALRARRRRADVVREARRRPRSS
jgi:hypothetical protein